MRMMSNRSPRLRTSPVGCLLFFRMATRSTTPRHSPLPTPRKETNFQRSAIRELKARNIVSAHRPVACALTCAGVLSVLICASYPLLCTHTPFGSRGHDELSVDYRLHLPLTPSTSPNGVSLLTRPRVYSFVLS